MNPRPHTVARADAERIVFEESLALFPPWVAWPVLAFSAYLALTTIWNSLSPRGDPELWLSIPGAIGFLAVGLIGVGARQHLHVTTDEIRVGNSARRTTHIPLATLQRAEVTRRPPDWRPRWPAAGFRMYAFYGARGVLLTSAGGNAIFVGSKTPDECLRAIAAVAPQLVSE